MSGKKTRDLKTALREKKNNKNYIALTPDKNITSCSAVSEKQTNKQ